MKTFAGAHLLEPVCELGTCAKEVGVPGYKQKVGQIPSNANELPFASGSKEQIFDANF